MTTVSVADEDFFRPLKKYLGVHDAPTNVELEYLAEGAANVIWALRFNLVNATDYSDRFVLRMRKDLPALSSTKTLQDQYAQCIAPLFAFDPSLILPSDLLELSTGLVESLNDQLRSLEVHQRRPKQRQQIYHPSADTEPYAQILPNLLVGPGKTLEFKPKWLTQSPSAPPGAERCRTCALNAMKRSKEKHQGRGDLGFCPLDLLTGNTSVLSAALRNIWKHQASLPSFVVAFKSRLQPVLQHILTLQIAHNHVGLEDFQDPEGKNLPLAMALRDCSIFIKFEDDRDNARVVITDIKLLDLDLKTATRAKTSKWAQMEAELIDKDRYFARMSPEVSCALGRAV